MAIKRTTFTKKDHILAQKMAIKKDQIRKRTTKKKGPQKKDHKKVPLKKDHEKRTTKEDHKKRTSKKGPNL